MGISGLLPVLKPTHRQVHLRDYHGKSIAVDGYVWLHKAAFGCALDLCTGKETRKYVDFCMRKTNDLIDNGIWPIIVFDGGHLPNKMDTEQKRRDRKRKLKEMGMDYLKQGNKTKAVECFQQCVDVTPLMARHWIDALKQKNIEFIVAPYEADAQLAYLCKTNAVYAVISEDSDLLAFGCTRVLFKLQANLTATEICINDLGLIKEMRFWDHTRFRQMCILAGCDYLDSPPGIGVKTAIKLLQKTDAYTLLKSWKVWGSAAKAPKLPDGYQLAYKMADLTFLHHWVYDPTTAKCVHLNEYPDEHLDIKEQLLGFIGKQIDPEIVKGIAHGELDPITFEKFDTGVSAVWKNSKESTVHKVGGSKPKISQSRITLKPKLPQLLNQKVVQQPINSNFFDKSKIILKPSKTNQIIPLTVESSVSQSKSTMGPYLIDRNLITSSKSIQFAPKVLENPKEDYKSLVSDLLDTQLARKPQSVVLQAKRKLNIEPKRTFKASRMTDFWKVVPKRETTSPYFKPKET